MPDADGADALDPDCAAVVRELEARGLPEWHTLSVASARRLEDDLFSPDKPPDDDLLTREIAIDGPGGELPLRAYHHGDKSNDTIGNRRPTLVFAHGGGWTLGTLDSADGICRSLAARTGALVLSVDYRLAPEHPFPAGVDDLFRAVEWAAVNADGLGGGGPLGVAGTSAGGGLAAAVALRAGLDEAAPDLATQALLYPMLDRDDSRESYAEHADGPLLTAADIEWFWDQYLRSPVDVHNPFAAPLRAREALLADALAGTDAVVATAGHDVLRDEGQAYAARLRTADVTVEAVHEPGLCHGFCSLTDAVPAADTAMDAVCAALRVQLGVEA